VSNKYINDDFYDEDKYYYQRGLVSDIVYYEKGREQYTLRHKYDQFGNLIQKYKYRNEKKSSIVEFEYNEFNRLIKKRYLGKSKFIPTLESVHNVKVSSEDVIEFTYIYQENGLMKSKTQYKNGIAFAKLNFGYIQYE